MSYLNSKLKVTTLQNQQFGPIYIVLFATIILKDQFQRLVEENQQKNRKKIQAREVSKYKKDHLGTFIYLV